MEDLMTRWKETLAEHRAATTDIYPVNCKVIKREQKRQAFMKKIPVRLGGGEKKKMKITKVEVWECDAVEKPKQSKVVVPPAVEDTKEHPKIPVKKANYKEGVEKVTAACVEPLPTKTSEMIKDNTKGIRVVIGKRKQIED